MVCVFKDVWAGVGGQGKMKGSLITSVLQADNQGAIEWTN